MEISLGTLMPMLIATIGLLFVANGIFKLAIGLFLAVIIHECGHSLIASLFGKSIKFEVQVTKLLFIPLPRLVWSMPEDVTVKQNNIIALSGFGLELLFAIILLLLKVFGYSLPTLCTYYIVASVIHLILYPLYAGEYNDFNMIIKSSDAVETEDEEVEVVEDEIITEDVDDTSEER